MKYFHGAFFILLIVMIISSEKAYSQKNFDNNYFKFSGQNLNYNLKRYNVPGDSVQKKSGKKTIFRMKKNPWKAVALSAILPGAGQFYNESYWKIPVIAGLGGYFVYEWIQNNNEYQDYKQLYIDSQTPENPSGNPQLQSLREFYRDQRDDFLIYSLILYVVNLLDSYVDAQLFDFDVSDEIKIRLSSNQNLIKLGINF